MRNLATDLRINIGSFEEPMNQTALVLSRENIYCINIFLFEEKSKNRRWSYFILAGHTIANWPMDLLQPRLTRVGCSCSVHNWKAASVLIASYQPSSLHVRPGLDHRFGDEKYCAESL
jgi:hypothetical protein